MVFPGAQAATDQTGLLRFRSRGNPASKRKGQAHSEWRRSPNHKRVERDRGTRICNERRRRATQFTGRTRGIKAPVERRIVSENTKAGERVNISEFTNASQLVSRPGTRPLRAIGVGVSFAYSAMPPGMCRWERLVFSSSQSDSSSTQVAVITYTPDRERSNHLGRNR